MSTDYRAYALPAKPDSTETVRHNLAEISDRLRPLNLARAFWLGELIGEFSEKEHPDRDTLQSIFESLFQEKASEDPYGIALHHADCLTLCHEIAAAYPSGYETVFAELFGEHVPPAVDASGRVAYVQNSYTEQAFMELTGFIKQRRVAYFHTFDDVCQEVRGGLCEYGILPVESTAEGLMAGLFRQIELYDLRICALCRVKTANDGYTSFALVRKTLLPTAQMQQHYLDFLCAPADPNELGELISVSSLCGHTLHHCATYQGHGSETFRLRLGINPDTLYPFLLYLALFCADISPLGFYMIK